MARSTATTIRAAIESFDRSRWDLKPSTKRGYTKALGRFDKYLGGGTLADLSADSVNDYLASIADHRTMARNDCIALRQLSQWATKSGIFQRDPLNGVELPKGRGGKRTAFLDTEVRTIIQIALDSTLGIRDRAIIIVGLSASLRPSELAQLTLADLDLRDGWLTVRLETTKSEAGERSIPLDPQAIAVLDEYIHDVRGTKPGPLWLNARREPFTHYGFMAIFARLHAKCAEQGIDFQAYKMRHTGITNWARVGLTAPIIKQLAGHRSIVTTENYMHTLNRDDLARVPGAFSKLYGRVAG